MECDRLVARGEHIPQTNIEPGFHYCDIVQHLIHPGTLYGTNQSNTRNRWGSTLHIYGGH